MADIGINEIARLAGVSKTTVSRVINKKPDVKLETRKKIEEIIAQYDFHPNAYAKAISERKSHTIGLIIPYDEDYIFLNPYYSEIMRGVSNEAKQQGYHLMLTYSKDDDYISIIREKRVDGVIIISPGSNHIKVIEKLKDLNIPFVASSRIPNIPSINYIGTDDYKGACMVIEYLISLGHREICFINGPEFLASSADRLDGYKNTLEKHGIKFNEDCTTYGDTSVASGYKNMKDLLKNHKTTAVFAGSDLMAIGAISAIVEAGKCVPGDVSVVGFDDIPLTSYINPPLTTVRQPIYEKGRLATKMLLNIIEDKPTEKSIILPVELIIKESAKKIR